MPQTYLKWTTELLEPLNLYWLELLVKHFNQNEKM